jgi:hypothetical protein
VAVGIPSGNVECNHRPLDQIGGRCDRVRQLIDEPGDYVSPGLLCVVQVEGFDCLFGSLMGDEAGPLEPSGLGAGPCLLEVAFGLFQPVSGAVCHCSSSASLSRRP